MRKDINYFNWWCEMCKWEQEDVGRKKEVLISHQLEQGTRNKEQGTMNLNIQSCLFRDIIR
jgi:hypothetical protein